MKRYISMLLLGGALTLTPGLQADDHHDRERRMAQERREWNEREERAYKRYVQEQHRQYREWGKLNRKEQDSYWKWRQRHDDTWLDRHH